MMSLLPGEITKQILSAPPWIMRSTRYSLTAQGRSVTPSRRLPTGRSSLEKASGWMRLPRPAAGTMPHMSGLHRFPGRERLCGTGGRDRRFEIARPPRRRMLRENPLAGIGGDALQLGVAEVEGGDGILARAPDQNVTPRREKGVEPFPPVRQDGRAAGRRLEQAPGRAPAHFGHGLPGDVEGQPRGREERRVLGRRQVPHEEDVVGPGKILRILRTADQE